MIAMYNGEPIMGQRGPAGPDGNPIGTVISYMGLTAPADYLLCDGASYDISAYPDLAKFFEKQFGTVNHFGGDGETTFAVPDLRDRFLLGSGTREVGEIGGEEEVTLTVEQMPKHNHSGVGRKSRTPETSQGYSGVFLESSNTTGGPLYDDTIPYAGSDQPHTNMPPYFVLTYCIKCKESVSIDIGGSSAGEVYPEEETVIGTWTDGRPLYRKITKVQLPNDDSISNGVNLDTVISQDFDNIVEINIIVDLGGYGDFRKWPMYTNRDVILSFQHRDLNWAFLNVGSTLAETELKGAIMMFDLKYTKTTD